MGRTNACKAEQKRARNAKDAPKEAKSILKDKEKIMSLQCSICKQAFMCTTRRQVLVEHATARHPRETPEKCFPNLPAN